MRISAVPAVGRACTLPFLAFAIARTMYDRDDDNLSPLIVHLVNDDVRTLDQLSCPLDKTWTSHVGKSVGFEEVYPVPNFRNSTGRRSWVVFCNPASDMIEVGLSRLSDNDFHTPYRWRRRSLNSASVWVPGFFSASRRRTSAACSSVSRRSL